MNQPDKPVRHLTRELGVPGATVLGLGSMLGSGVFLSIGLGVGVVGPAVVLAIAVAAAVAACNALSSAQLAANHPRSGGSYEYGYIYLGHVAGFAAGWTFLLAKSASAATAALAFAGYLAHALGLAAGWHVPLALLTVAALTLLVLGGLRRSTAVVLVLLTIALAALIYFVVGGAPAAWARGAENYRPFLDPLAHDGLPGLGAFFHATALMFVAYTGYGRIATMGEEVRQPRRTIPRAIIATVAASMVIYLAVSLVGVGSVGAEFYYRATIDDHAPLGVIAEALGLPGGRWVLALGALAALLMVLLNLILGLSRVVLAMARRHDLPPGLARLSPRGHGPTAATLFVGAAMALLALSGNVRATWSFSAFAVLIYYAITNLAALRIPRQRRLYPWPIAAAGLAACIFLAFWVEARYWMAGLAMLGLGLAWQLLARRLYGPGSFVHQD